MVKNDHPGGEKNMGFSQNRLSLFLMDGIFKIVQNLQQELPDIRQSIMNVHCEQRVLDAKRTNQKEMIP